MTTPKPQSSPDQMALRGSPFTATSRGVFFRDEAAGESIQICSQLHIDAATRDQNNENWGRLGRVIDSEGKEHSFVLPAAMLVGDAAAVLGNLVSKGLVLMNKRSKDLVTSYLQEPPQKLVRCCNKIGWLDNSFVLPDVTFSPPGTEEIRFQSNSLNHFEGLTVKGSLEAWRESIGAMSASNSRLVFPVSMAFAGPLLELSNEQGGGIHIVGTSSDGKTTGAKACISVMGSPTTMHTWRATANGLENIAGSHNHLTLCLDELAQMNAMEAADIAYMLGNGQGKHRADQSGQARPPFRWLLLVLSTGEVTLAEHAETVGKFVKGGAEVRFLNIGADAGAGHRMFENLHGSRDGAAFSQLIKEAAEANFGHPLRAFLNWLVPRRAEVEAELRSVIDSFVQRNAGNTSAEVQRAAKRFALIGAAGELATEANITGWPKGEAMWAAERCFQSYLEIRGTVGESDTEKGVKNVLAFIEKNGASRFQDLGSRYPDKIHNRAGFFRNTGGRNEYFIVADVFRSEICKGADYIRVAKQLAERGFLRHDIGRWTKKERLPGLGSKNVYVLVFEEDSDDDATEGNEDAANIGTAN